MTAETTFPKVGDVPGRRAGILACGEGAAAGAKWQRLAVRIVGGMLLCGLVICASVRNLSAYRPPSALQERTWPMSIVKVADLAADAKGTAAICAKYHVSLVIPGDGFFSAFKEAWPVMSGHAFETVYPPSERRAFRIIDERKRLHSAVLIYRPSLVERFYAQSVFPHSRTVSSSPPLLLIKVDKPMTGFDIAEKLGYHYNDHL